jgi:hypothetical protein
MAYAFSAHGEVPSSSTRAPAAGVTLSGLRREVNLTQVQVAERLAASQRAVSHLEHEPNPRVGTLSNYVEALGGRLELRAVFPDRAVHLNLREPQ